MLSNYKKVNVDKEWLFDVELMKCDEPDYLILIDKLYNTIDNPFDINNYISVKFSKYIIIFLVEKMEKLLNSLVI